LYVWGYLLFSVFFQGKFWSFSSQQSGNTVLKTSVATAGFFSLDLGFFCFIWGSGVFIENLELFDSGQILEMYVVLLYFPFKNTVIS